MNRAEIDRMILRVDCGLTFGELTPYVAALRSLLAETDAMRPVAEAAEAWADAFTGSAAFDALEAAVEAYRASKATS